MCFVCGFVSILPARGSSHDPLMAVYGYQRVFIFDHNSFTSSHLWIRHVSPYSLSLFSPFIFVSRLVLLTRDLYVVDRSYTFQVNGMQTNKACVNTMFLWPLLMLVAVRPLTDGLESPFHGDLADFFLKAR
jgi:hypothetical protein